MMPLAVPLRALVVGTGLGIDLPVSSDVYLRVPSIPRMWFGRGALHGSAGD